MDEHVLRELLSRDCAPRLPLESVKVRRIWTGRRPAGAVVVAAALAAFALVAPGVRAGSHGRVEQHTSAPAATACWSSSSSAASEAEAVTACRRYLLERGLLDASARADVQTQPAGRLVEFTTGSNSSDPAAVPGDRQCDVEPARATTDPSRTASVRAIHRAGVAAASLDGPGTVSCRAAESALVLQRQPGTRTLDELRAETARAVRAAATYAAASSLKDVQAAATDVKHGMQGVRAFYSMCLAHKWGGNRSLGR